MEKPEKDYDPEPEHMKEAWDKMIQALKSGKTLSKEEMITLNEPFLEELKKIHTPEELEEMFKIKEVHEPNENGDSSSEDNSSKYKMNGEMINSLHNFMKLFPSQKDNDSEEIRFLCHRPNEKGTPPPRFTEESGKRLFQFLYWDEMCPSCKQNGKEVRMTPTSTPGKTYLECPNCPGGLSGETNMGTCQMLLKNKLPHDYFRENTYSDLISKLPDEKGVYIITERDLTKPLYIGSAGKMIKGGGWNKSTIRKRLSGATTPYHFDKKTDFLFYGPTSPGVPPSGYNHQIPISKIDVWVIIPEGLITPSALEHYLIQCFIFQYGDLPEINQKI